MDKLTIKTDHKPRSVLRWHELTSKEHAEFDYIDTETKQGDAEFVRCRGGVYDLHDMERGFGNSEMPRELAGWDNYRSDSYFSGIVIHWADQGERVIVGRYYC
jgi:hypothetical protein